MLGLDVAIVDNVNVVYKEEVLVLNVTVVSSVLNENKVVARVEVSVVLHISSFTITASTGQQGIPPHSMDNSADNFVQMPEVASPFTISYLCRR